MAGFVLMVNVGLSFEPAKRAPTGELQADAQGLGSPVANRLEVRLVEMTGLRRSLAPPAAKTERFTMRAKGVKKAPRASGAALSQRHLKQFVEQVGLP
jgi:hypothetical protein